MKKGIVSLFIMGALLLSSFGVDAQGRGKKKGHYKHKHNKTRYYEGRYYDGHRHPRPVIIAPPPAPPHPRHLPRPPLPPHPGHLPPPPPPPPHPFR